MMFMAVYQCNLGGPSAVSDEDELVTVAKYNLTAGKHAMEMSGFPPAFRFFFCGTKFYQAIIGQITTISASSCLN
jgi:hypothetical protein